MKKLLLILILLSPIVLLAQNNVSGKIIDRKTREPIDITSIYAGSNGTISNELGEFVLMTSSDTLLISHLSYHAIRIAVTGEFLNIELEPKEITLEAAVIRPNAFLHGVYEKYEKIFKEYFEQYSKQGKKYPTATFYYRQDTSQDGINTEFIECFFNGNTTSSLYNLAIKQGRYAKIKEKGKRKNRTLKEGITTLKNGYLFSSISPITFYEIKKNYTATPLCQGREDIFDIKLESLIEANTSDEIRIYTFTPKKKQDIKLNIIVGGSLHIRTRDSSIVKFIGESAVYNIKSPIGLNIFSEKYNFTVTYKDSEFFPVPIVESIKGNLQFKSKVLIFRKISKVNVNMIMYATEYNIGIGDSEEILKGESLLKTLEDHKYDPTFWKDNPIIKRTPIENKIIDDFNRLGYFGNFEL